jgi:hypothetical protein
MLRKRNAILGTLLAAAIGVGAPPLHGDVFVLTTGGEIHGELLNPNESPRRRYVIRPYAGGKVTVAAATVTNVVRQRPIEIAYDQMKLEMGNTIDGQWKLAEWCRDNGLLVQRDSHLQRVIQLDPNHAEARRLLGYSRDGDRWLTRDEEMKARGYVKYNGRWIVRQQADIFAKRDKERAIKKKYYDEIRRWRGWLDRDERSVAAEAYISDIRSPYAIDALLKNFESVKKYEHKVIFARALGNIQHGSAVQNLVEWSIRFDDLSDKEENEDFRYLCFDLLEKKKPPMAVAMYINALRSDKNHEVNRGAIGLVRMGDKTAVQPLIDALVTEHKFKIGRGNPGQTTTSFGGPVGGSGGTSFGTGGGPKVVKRLIRNEEVLAALQEMTGKDFHFDQRAWHAWHKTQKPDAPKINTRRD